ncbi:hypothetical protein BDZ89DRAFT_1072318 [Hymenopellis radicata]|nr:hypothetical protein BDZ89DRAFT_1072318 [Hymenopellis radicata]
MDDDPAFLFTPTKPPAARSATPPAASVAAPRTPERRARSSVYILAPPLPSAEKRTYRDMSESVLSREITLNVDEVVGEWKENGKEYLYARYKEESCRGKYPELVDDYNRAKEAGELEDFDPNTRDDIHPTSRPSLKLRIRQRRPAAPDSDVVMDSEPDRNDEESEEPDDDADENFEADDAPNPSRRSTRTHTKQTTLPFSPKKTRSRQVFTVDDSDAEESEDDTGAAPTRRSTRTRRAVKVNLREDSYEPEEDDEEDDDNDNYDSHRKRLKGPAKSKKKPASRPAYGHFRPIADMDYDSEEETASLRAHRTICEKCHTGPTHIKAAAAQKKKGKGRRKKKTSDDEIEEDSADELTRIQQGGGWVRCLKCPVTAHWKCLASTQRDEILKAARSLDRVAWLIEHPDGDVDKDGPRKRPGLDMNETTEFICGSCMKGGICMSCKEVALQPELSRKDLKALGEEAGNEPSTSTASPTKEPSSELLFRCFTCKRVSHYAELEPKGDEDAPAEIAESYQKNWLCNDCASFTYPLDKILAWRPYPETAVEENPLYPHYQDQLPREYLVKWEQRSFRRTSWVPHMWLLSTHPNKLKNFIVSGPKVELLSASAKKPAAVEEPDSIFADDGSRDSSTIDRILDLRLWYVGQQKSKSKSKSRSKSKKGRSSKRKGRRVESEEEEEQDDDDAMDVDVETFGPEYHAAFDEGEQPDDAVLDTIEDWEARTGQDFSSQHAPLVVWAFIKWDDLAYDEASWDSPPRPDDPTYPAFENALNRYIKSRTVKITKLSAQELKAYEDRPLDEQDPKLKLMPFQVDGFNWLSPCILADEMGLGKTVQIATFIGNVASNWNACPALVVVPNSTITNWVREFERWAPELRVVPFYGEAKARDVIKKYELSHRNKVAGQTSAKFHVLVTTYEALLNPKDFGTVFKSVPRWEILVIDEGQRLKNDESLLFRKLNELKSFHRIIMTGTPLNNNIRELFNLMNFLDPDAWSDLAALEQEYEELTEELVKQLHERLRPYFLRRIKSQVLTLPPKNEVIVPVSMAPLQKEVYRSILSHNSELLKGLTTGGAGNQSRSRINNVLMQLRKCLQHPYLYSEDIEPRNLPPKETHEKLIDASAKLRFLKMLLPKLKARGHRVLLFSQFVIALDIIEDFLVGEGVKCLRLDGNTKGADRQKGMDEFNKPGSDVFIYLLTTRAGGVGINLFTADTVIIFDPDFNPHQAIARAYRFGQKKTCLVFKLMVKESAEERIVQVGKKKMVLDHLIVQKMDEDESAGENVQSILTFGASALFDTDETHSHDITYTDADVDNLIEKTEQEKGDEQDASKEGGGMFSFAKIWTADRDTLEEVRDEDQGDSWAVTLQKINAERQKIQAQQEALSGRGARRKATAIPVRYIDEESPLKKSTKGKKPSASSDEESDFAGSDPHPEDYDDSSDDDAPGVNGDVEMRDLTSATPTRKPKKDKPLHQIQNVHVENCGLCGSRHGDGEAECPMTEDSANLAEYRQMLLLNADDEPIEDRRAAIAAIDEVLYRRKQTHLIAGQPLHLVEKRPLVAPAVKKKPKPVVAQPPKVSAPIPATKRPAPSPPPPSSSPVASTSKRSSSPAPMISAPLKKKIKADGPCVVCTQGYHPLENCPTITLGPRSVSKEIKRLEAMPGMSVTVAHLRSILTKQKKKALAEANAAALRNDVMVVDSD